MTKKPLSIEEFNALPSPRQRVIIAKDVLGHLNSRHYVAEQQTYLRLGDDEYYKPIPEDKQLQEVLKEAPVCYVCAIGGVFAAAVERCDQLTMGEMSGCLNDFRSQRKYLSQWFSDKQLSLMEAAFEGSVVYAPESSGLSSIGESYNASDLQDALDDGDGDADWIRDAIEACTWSNHYDDEPSVLLRAIMVNIIDYHGHFAPGYYPSTKCLINSCLEY